MEQLFTRAKSGDFRAEQELFRNLYVRFLTLAKRRIGEGEAKDIAQDACLTVLQKYKTETFTKGFGAWAYGVLRMKIGNYMQGLMEKQKGFVEPRESDAPFQVPTPEPLYDLKRELIECLQKMAARNRRHIQVISLFYQGYKTSEISDRLRIKPGNLHTLLHRVRQLLRLCLETGRI